MSEHDPSVGGGNPEATPPQPPPATPGPPQAAPAAAPAAEPAAAPAAVPSSPRGSAARTWILAGLVAVVVAAGVFMGLEAFSGGSGAAQSPNAAANGVPGAGNAAPGAGNAAPNGNPDGFARPGSFTVSSIDGSTIGVNDPNGVVREVTTNGETRITSNDVVTLGALKVGDHVRVVGTGTEAAIAADRITDSGDRASTGGFPGRGFRNRQGNGRGNGTADGNSSAATPPGGGQVPPDAVPGNGSTPGNDTGRAFVSGTIASIDGSTVTITLTPDSGMTSSGTSTATVSDTTVITKSTPIKVSDLNDGDRIVVFGTTSGSTLAATDVIRGDIRPGAARSPGR